MYNILIIEDEYYERIELKRQLEREFPKFSIYTAKNIKDSLILLEDYDMDLVLLDIMLNNSSGLELAENIKINMKDTEIIIITAYNEFDFAHKALRLGVKEYLLKPVRPEKLHRLIRDMKEGKDRESINNIEYEEELWKQIIENNYNILTDSLSYQLKALGLIYTNQLIDKDIEILKSFLKKKKIIFESVDDYYLLYFSYNHIVYLEQIIEDMISKLDIRLVVETIEEENIRESYNKLFTKYNDFVFYNNKNYLLDNINIESKPRKYPFDLEIRLLNALKENNKKEMENTIEDIVSYFIKNSGYQYDIVKKWLVSLYYYLIRYCNIEIDIDMNNIDLLIRENGMNIYDVLKTAIENIYGQLEIKFRINNILIVKTINIISNRYMEDLNLELISNELYVNPIYLSRLFKEEIGEGFKSYLTKVRLEKAAFLLLNTKNNITDIVYLTGYNDINYFGKCFKKYYSFSPSEYRIIFKK